LALRVFASGSQGNCTLLRAGSAHVLIDLGLSPRRTAALLAAESLTFDDLEAVLLTHLDHDHAHAGWCAQIGTDAPLPRHVEVFVPRTSLGRAQRMGFNAGRALPFRSPFRTRSGLRVDPLMNFHDALGSAAFRLTLETTSIGFATDLGRVTDELVAHLRHVDVLAIESNYCPALQAASPRPTFLKRRITGGRGHLSNAECREATSLIAPRTHTLLLHLSRQCNTPELAAAPHAGAPYGLTICNQHGPSPWVAAAK
jgi:phosphoribosyl 1,2-cyclic phosphodiesterase